MSSVVPVRLDKALTQGYLRFEQHLSGYNLSPRKGYCWIILGGYVVHVTGTATQVYIDDNPTAGRVLCYIFQRVAGDASENVTLFSTNVGNQMQWMPLVITEQMRIVQTGAALAGVAYIILEWKK